MRVNALSTCLASCETKSFEDSPFISRLVLEDAENRCGLGCILDQFAEQFCFPAKPYD